MRKTSLEIAEVKELQLKAFIKEHTTLINLANKLNITPRSLSFILSHDKHMNLERIKEILAAIGYELTLHITSLEHS